MRRLLLLAVALAATALTTTPALAASGGPATLAIIGDTPYGDAQIANFHNDIAQLNADPDVSWVVHLGDIKNGSTVCSDSYFSFIRTSFDSFADPLVYTPGDNEWTDCHRANNGGYVPTERLAKLRSLFFDRPGITLGKPALVLPEGRQYPENVLWRNAGVLFSVLNVPGSNNDLVPWFGAPAVSAEQQQEYDGRLRADLLWLDATFAAARLTRAPAVAIGIQADMFDPAAILAGQVDGFAPFVERLAKLTRAYGKPVLLMNGDSHVYEEDRPLENGSPVYPNAVAAPNLRRLTVQGSTSVPHEWLKLRVDPRSPEVFSWQNVAFSATA